jgi:hypothetical protein
LAVVSSLVALCLLLWLHDRDQGRTNAAAFQAAAELDRFADQMAAVKSGAQFRAAESQLARQADLALQQHRAYTDACPSRSGVLQRLRAGPSQQAQDAVRAAMERFNAQTRRYNVYLTWAHAGGKLPVGEPTARPEDVELVP